MRIDLPATAATTPATAPAPASAAAGEEPRHVGDWALLAGGALCGLALFGLLLLYALNRSPRARGVAIARRGIDMDRMTDRAEWVSDTILRRRGGIAAVSRTLELAGLDLRPGELFGGIAAGSVVLFAIGWIFLSPAIGVVLALLVPIGARVVVSVLADLRRKKFLQQLPETLQILAGSQRAGHGLSQAIETVAREASSPTSDEFRRLTIETRLGRGLVESLRGLSDRVGSEEFQWVVQAIEIQREVGGDLAAILDTLAGTVRDRAKVKLQVSALSAEGRLSAMVLMVLPFGLGALMSVTNPDYVKPLFTTGTGYTLLAIAAALLAVGGLWLRRIVKPTF